MVDLLNLDGDTMTDLPHELTTPFYLLELHRLTFDYYLAEFCLTC